MCEDDGQYVGWNRQHWTTHEALSASHALRLGEDAGLAAICGGE